ncbi:MAG: hypothetical protein BKP49_04255 [Treponema sp. CETP13]|nr:MAG: hypothetical protein BKP49_04255 [Treponema sp. CETP13]
MQYRRFPKIDDTKISVLGFGCMRLPLKKIDVNSAATNILESHKIDYEKAKNLFKLAFDNGVNYYDTAWPYHKGQSEGVLGRALNELGIRDKVYIADKCPIWEIKCEEDWAKYIDLQLERLNTDHIDFYLLHAMDANRWQTVLKYNGIKHLEKAKVEGKIRHLGFSFHDNHDAFKQIVDGYDGWEFCQLMINLIDTHADESKGFKEEGLINLEYAEKHEIGVIAMEPLRGGLIARPPENVKAIYAESNIPRFGSEWGLRWVWNHQNIICSLSGMNEEMHILVNSATASAARPNSLLKKELKVCKKAGDWYRQKMIVPCTGCSYCMPCPAGVQIPDIFKEYNRLSMSGKLEYTAGKTLDKKIASELYLKLKNNNQGADQCVKCGKCEQACPQHIHIRDFLQEINTNLL